MNSKVSTVFGRSPEFIIINLENDEIKESFSFENPAKYDKGAGNLAAQFMVKNRVDVLISGEMGPVAFHILKNAGIIIYKVSLNTVEKNLKKFREGNLEEITTLSSGYPK